MVIVALVFTRQWAIAAIHVAADTCTTRAAIWANADVRLVKEVINAMHCIVTGPFGSFRPQWVTDVMPTGRPARCRRSRCIAVP